MLSIETITSPLSTIATYTPTVLAIAVIETLLSMDNAIVLTDLVSRLPQEQRAAALRMGIPGAYVLRGACVMLAALILRFTFLNALVPIFLLYLCFKNLSTTDNQEAAKPIKVSSFWNTVLLVELTNLALSIDNAAAAVAMSANLYVVACGVFIGILAVRLISGWFAKLTEQFPGLGKFTYILVGLIGFQLLVKYFFHFEVSTITKLVIVSVIGAVALLYSKITSVKKLCDPFLAVSVRGMATTVNGIHALTGKLPF